MIKSFRAALFVASVAAGAWSVSCGSSTGHGSGFEPPDASMSSGSSSGSSSGAGPSDGGPKDATSSGSYNDAPSLFGDSSGSFTDAPQMFDVEPSTLQTIMVTAGQTMPGVTYKATLNGLPIKAAWTIDRGDLATIGAGPSTQATVLPTGTTGGLVNVIAGLNGQTLKRQVFIQLTAQQSGANPNAPGESAQVPTNVAQLGAGGGVGGVGGEGLGVAVTDPTTLAGLTNPTGTGQAQKLTLLYPYDQTVFPRGMLAPLLQWDWTVGDADAIQITLRTTSGSFSWTGTFGRPAILMQTGGKFIRHPIPQDVWTMASNTAGGPTSNGMTDQLVLTLVVAKAGQGYGPLTETWTVAPGRLEGAIYYNSYGTALVKNSATDGLDYYGHQYGAGTLSIAPGATSPTVAAGVDSPADGGNGTGCRVCHTVSGDGKTLVTQASNISATDYTETMYINLANDTTAGAGTAIATKGLAFPAITKDGSLLLSGAGGIGYGDSLTRLYAMPAGTPVTGVTGLGTNFQGSLPAFSPDTKHVSFNFWSGSLTAGTTTLNADKISLGLLDFDGVSGFSNPRILYTPTGGAAVTYSSFLPTSTGVVFESELANPSGWWGFTWGQNTGELWWVDTATSKAHRLDQVNGYTPAGTNYLPTCDCDGGTGGAPTHTPAQDATLNYEPTVSPIASGGYAWVVFTSRRMYGNVAQLDPWASDPRHYPWLDQVTDKKLWVAAIDLNATPGADASHPAFYLPAQELHAGNARGYWTIAPCRPDGQSCMSGDMCCGGYCEPGADGGLVCANTPPNTNCSAPQEKCTTSADCCDSTNQCIDGFCSMIPR